MTELLGYGLIALIVAALLFYGVVALLPAGLTVAPVRDDIPDELPRDRLVSREDLLAVRLPVVLRGYRMADTDDLLDRLTLEIAVRDRELEQLRGSVAASDLPGAPDEPAVRESALREAPGESAVREAPASAPQAAGADSHGSPEARHGVRPLEPGQPTDLPE